MQMTILCPTRVSTSARMKIFMQILLLKNSNVQSMIIRVDFAALRSGHVNASNLGISWSPDRGMKYLVIKYGDNAPLK